MDKRIKFLHSTNPEKLGKEVNKFLSQRTVYSASCQYQHTGTEYTVMIQYEEADMDAMLGIDDDESVQIF